MPDPLLSVSSLATVDALADETIPSMQYGSLNPEHQVLGAYTNRLRNVRFTADLRVRREFVTLRFYRATQLCYTVLGVVILSVCLSATRVLCDNTKQCTADISVSQKRAITLVL